MTLTARWNALEGAAWNDALAALPYAAFQQSYAYGQVAKASGVAVERAALYLGDRLIALAQLQLRRAARLLPIATCLRGPLWLDTSLDLNARSAAYSALYRSMPLRRPRAVLWMPESEDSSALEALGLRQVISPYHTLMLDLRCDAAQLRAQLASKWRRSLEEAETQGLKLNRLRDYGFVLEAEARQSARKRYAALHPLFVPAYQFECGQESVLCLSAQQRGETVAAVLCLIHGQAATYHIGWTSEAGRAIKAHHFLLWHAIKTLHARQIALFDLGGVHTDKGGEGIARFKMGTGASVHSLCGTYF